MGKEEEKPEGAVIIMTTVYSGMPNRKSIKKAPRMDPRGFFNK
jgi:hypothetical protein